jgi:polysaccharide pyruvyl transferase WcaK-like protein
MSYRDPRGWPRPEPRIYAAFVRKLADFCAGLVEGGYRVILVTTQSKTDPAASADILARTRTALPPAARQWAQAADPEGVPDLLSILSEADFCVASRFHGVVLSMRLGKPVIALSYEDKTDALMEKAGLAGFNLDIESFSEVTLRAAFDRLVSDQAAIAGSVAAHARENRRRLESQLRTVLGSESRKTIAGRRTKRSG